MESIKAWEAFCEELKRAGTVLAGERTPKDDLSQAEGLRKLVRLVRMGLEATLEYGDTDHPAAQLRPIAEYADRCRR